MISVINLKNIRQLKVILKINFGFYHWNFSKAFQYLVVFTFHTISFNSQQLLKNNMKGFPVFKTKSSDDYFGILPHV